MQVRTSSWTVDMWSVSGSGSETVSVRCVGEEWRIVPGRS